MKIISFILLNLICFGLCTAQNNTFFKFYSNTYIGNSLTLTSDGLYAITGSTNKVYNNTNIFLLKADEFGDTIWTKIYDLPFFDIGFSIQETYDRGFVIAGQAGKPDSIGSNVSNIFVLKTNPFGDTIWTFNYNTAIGQGIGDRAFSIEQLVDSSYILTGHVNDGINTPKTPKTVLLKLDKNGHLLWEKTYEDYTRTQTVIQTLDGGFMICGYPYLLKTNAIGDTLWVKRDRGATDILQLPDSNFIVTGGITVNDAANVFISKIDKNGNTIWTKDYGGEKDDYSLAIDLVGNDGFIITGDTYSYATGAFYNANIWLLRLDVNGDTLWTKSYGNIKNNHGFDVEYCPDGGFAITGATGNNIDPSNAFLLKTDSLGNAPILSSTMDALKQDQFGVNLYPNPGKEIISVELNTAASYADAIFTIYDHLGTSVQQFKSQNASTNLIQIDIRHLKQGVYFLTIQLQQQGIITKQFIKK